MCFTLPLKVISTSFPQAVMEDGRKVNLALVGLVKKNDYLLVKLDMAVEKLTKKEADTIRIAIKEVSRDII